MEERINWELSKREQELEEDKVKRREQRIKRLRTDLMREKMKITKPKKRVERDEEEHQGANTEELENVTKKTKKLKYEKAREVSSKTKGAGYKVADTERADNQGVIPMAAPPGSV